MDVDSFLVGFKSNVRPLGIVQADVEANIASFMSVEKQSRLQGDQAANAKLLCALVDICNEHGKLDFLVSLVPALSKKRSIIKEVF